MPSLAHSSSRAGARTLPIAVYMAKYIVRYGSMRMLGAFDYPEDKLFARIRVLARIVEAIEAAL